MKRNFRIFFRNAGSQLKIYQDDLFLNDLPFAIAVNSLLIPCLSSVCVPTGMRLAYRPTTVFVYFCVKWSSGASGPMTTSCVYILDRC